MELVSFSTKNFRSITKAYKIPIGRPTVIIGPNNEGKSNVLRAMVSALQYLSLLGGVRIRNTRVSSIRRVEEIYDWERDYPISLQTRNADGQTIFDLEFQLDASEIIEFKENVRSNLNGTLPVRLSFGQKDVLFQITKPGLGGQTLSKKAESIGRFIARRINIAHIPAVRTAESARSVVNDLVARELATVEQSEEYKKALDLLTALQKPILDRIGKSIGETLREFLPSVKDVQVKVPEADRYRALRRCEILVDDGTATSLDLKGDGVQSLAALGLLKQASDTSALGRHLILAVEEPESHLHPRAIHQLREILSELSQRHQVIITTHCPLFVDRLKLRSNIIVNNKKASAAKTIAELRDVLGVRSSDNLRNAELVLVVEGEEDRMSMNALLTKNSSKIAEALKNGLIAIDTLSGGSNLSYKLAQLRDSLCLCHSLLDNDLSGIQAADRAMREGLAEAAEITITSCLGLEESEFEDLLDVSLYEAFVKNKYGVTIQSPKFKGKKKWSDRVREIFMSQGKIWSDRVKTDLKNEIAKLVSEHADRALNAHRRGPFDAVVAVLEGLLLEMSGEVIEA
jgi:predicted ATP-binding protein involved in virulence